MDNKISTSINITVLIFLFLSFSNIHAQKYNVKNGTAFFKAKISFNSYKGTSNELSGSINFETGELEFSIPASSIITPSNKRNKHMYELINIDDYIKVSFKGVFVDTFNFDSREKQSLKIKGDFKLAGATKEIELSIDLTPEQSGLRLKAAWTLLITDYNLEPPTKAFITVKDKHEIGVDAYLIKN